MFWLYLGVSLVDHIICVIKGINKIESAQQRYRFRAKNWSIVNGKLYQTKVIEGDKNKKICLPVAWLEDFFVLLYDVHCIKRIHQGITKTFDQIKIRYHGITREVVDNFRKTCYICDLKKIQQSQPRLKPIVSNQVFEYEKSTRR